MQAKIQKIIERTVKEQIDKNLYLFKTDEDYTIQCTLKPRLISIAVENTCAKLKNLKLVEDYGKEYSRIFELTMIYAVYYIFVIREFKEDWE